MMMQTRRLRLVPFELEHAAALERSRSELAAHLGVDIPDGWPQFPEAYTVQNIAALGPGGGIDEIPTTWGSYLFLHRKEAFLVGSGGYKGRPHDGAVEIGYEIAPAFQNQGFATEAAGAMVAEALSHQEVDFVLAHTLPSRNASTRVLKKSGMEFVAVIDDPKDGPIWRWRLSRTKG